MPVLRCVGRYIHLGGKHDDAIVAWYQTEVARAAMRSNAGGASGGGATGSGSGDGNGSAHAAGPGPGVGVVLARGARRLPMSAMDCNDPARKRARDRERRNKRKRKR